MTMARPVAQALALRAMRRLPASRGPIRVGQNSCPRRSFSTTRSRGIDRSSHFDVQILPAGVQFKGLEDKDVRRDVLPHFWLRDNCRCTQCVHQQTMQRGFDTFGISEDISPEKITPEYEGLIVKWKGGHESLYPWDFINHYLKHDHRNPENVLHHLWGSSIATYRPSVHYEELLAPEDNSGIARLTTLLRVYGFVFVDETPFDTPDPTQKVLEKIAFIRETHYGGFYDFIPDMAKADTAYTNIALPAHTDTTYFSDPSGLQAFHMLSHEAPPNQSGSAEAAELGGKSLLVDGFHAAKVLLKEDPEAYRVLSKVRLPWHASGNEGITISPNKRYPVLEVDEPTGRLARVRWNNDDRGVVPFTENVSPTEWYAAARKWDTIIKRPDVEYWVQLKPGQVLIFDNWRVMHGRSSFEGRRRMCGGYINRDDFISRWRNTNFPRGEVLNQVVG